MPEPDPHLLQQLIPVRRVEPEPPRDVLEHAAKALEGAGDRAGHLQRSGRHGRGDWIHVESSQHNATWGKVRRKGAIRRLTQSRE